jgi:hypothetical protein
MAFGHVHGSWFMVHGWGGEFAKVIETGAAVNHEL